ncbi:MAG: signal peptidase II [Bacilli bacterium]
MKKNIYIISLVVLILDQIIKYYILSSTLIIKAITIIPDFFSLRFVKNYGAAWGIFQDKTFFLTIISGLTLILINKYLLNEKRFNKISIISYGLLIGGILGNFFDRIVHGFVIDYLDFTIFKYDFPVFNLADMAIVIGIILMFVEVVRIEINENNRRVRRKIKN